MSVLIADVGDLIRLKNWDEAHPLGFTNAAGAATDPTTVTLTVRKPDGSIVIYTYALAQVQQDSIGKFYYEFVPDQIGMWFFEWLGTGAVQAAEPSEFYVRSSKVA